MSLRIKAKIYQYTRIYLAHEEEIEQIYKVLPQALDKYLEQVQDDEHLSFETVIRLYVGEWQVKHGFYSRWIFFGFSWYYRLANAVCLPFVQLLSDIRHLARRLRRKCETRN